jgi:hypothetical protein
MLSPFVAPCEEMTFRCDDPRHERWEFQMTPAKMLERDTFCKHCNYADRSLRRHASSLQTNLQKLGLTLVRPVIGRQDFYDVTCADGHVFATRSKPVIHFLSADRPLAGSHYCPWCAPESRKWASRRFVPPFDRALWDAAAALPPEDRAAAIPAATHLLTHPSSAAPATTVGWLDLWQEMGLVQRIVKYRRKGLVGPYGHLDRRAG